MRTLSRTLALSKNHSFFLFGARNTGKSTLLSEVFSAEHTFWINLLEPITEAKYGMNPEVLIAEVNALPNNVTHVVIDEIQKVPKLLDVVHILIESTKKKFIMTGSSARKLKQAGVNLLAGRAFVFHLYPFTSFELGNHFKLLTALSRGTLPYVYQLKSDEERKLFLQSYAQSYLKEEIWSEHLIKKLDPFRHFLQVAAQANGKILNIANIANDVGVDDKTIKNYFEILEDTLVGYSLHPFHHSFRKRLSRKPKFYFFDPGIARALARLLNVIPEPGTSYYGDVFEHFIIVECFRLAQYYQNEYQFSYIHTKDGAEVDLVIDRPQKPLLFVEIKSSNQVKENDLKNLATLSADYGNCEAICLSQDPRAKKYGNISVYPWQEGLKHIFKIHSA